jgi:hypothetical protein
MTAFRDEAYPIEVVDELARITFSNSATRTTTM